MIEWIGSAVVKAFVLQPKSPSSLQALLVRLRQPLLLRRLFDDFVQAIAQSGVEAEFYGEKVHIAGSVRVLTQITHHGFEQEQIRGILVILLRLFVERHAKRVENVQRADVASQRRLRQVLSVRGVLLGNNNDDRLN